MHKLDRNMPCWCGSGKKYKHCHFDFDEKLDDMHRRGAVVPTHDMIKTEAQIAGIRESAKINVAVLDYVAAHIRAGISTAEIDRWVYEQTTAMGGIPAPLNYEGFPKSVCTSIDDQVCHGIPSEDDILCNGDIINVDCSTIYKGYYSDSSRMFIIGETTPEKKKLVEVTLECVNDSCNNSCKRSCRSCNLYLTSSQKGNHKSSYNCRINSALWAYARCKR